MGIPGCGVTPESAYWHGPEPAFKISAFVLAGVPIVVEEGILDSVTLVPGLDVTGPAPDALEPDVEAEGDVVAVVDVVVELGWEVPVVPT